MKQIEEKNNASNLRINEDAFLKLSKRKKILEQGIGYFTGYPSIDMPWLKYYTEEQIMAPIPHMSCYDYLRICNNNNLRNVAMQFGEEIITFKDLFKKITETSKALTALGVKPGEIVSIVLPACPEEAYLFYALDNIGACTNFIFPGTPILEIEQNMQELGSNKIIIFEELLRQPNNLLDNNNIKIVSTSFGPPSLTANNLKDWNDFIKEGESVVLKKYERNEDEPLFIAKTSGSTAKPKNVVLTDRAFNMQAQQHLNSTLDYTNGDSWVRVWPLFSASAAVSSMHLPFCYGMKLIIEPLPDIDKTDELLMRYKPTHMVMIASSIDSLLRSEIIKGQDLSFIKTLGIGGEGVTPEFEIKANKFMKDHNINSTMMYGYGMTENASGATSRFNQETSSPGAVGVPQVNTIVSIFDPETNEEKIYGEEGEICILSSSIMLGYYKNPEMTEKTIRLHSDGNLWLHSGDLGYMDENGHLFVKGRIKRMMMLFSGNKIYPADIEELIETIDEVERAIIVPEPDPIHEGAIVPCAFITLNTELTLEELRKKINEVLGEKMASYVNLNNIYIKKELPHTSIGKVDLQQLEKESHILAKRNK